VLFYYHAVTCVEVSSHARIAISSFFFDSPVRSSDKDRMAYPSPTFKHGIGVVKTKKKKEKRTGVGSYPEAADKSTTYKTNIKTCLTRSTRPSMFPVYFTWISITRLGIGIQSQRRLIFQFTSPVSIRRVGTLQRRLIQPTSRWNHLPNSKFNTKTFEFHCFSTSSSICLLLLIEFATVIQLCKTIRMLV